MHLLPPFLTLSVPSPTNSQKRRERERSRNRGVPPQTIKHKYLSIQVRGIDKNVYIIIRIFFFKKRLICRYFFSFMSWIPRGETEIQ